MYYLVPIIGDGISENPYRPKIDDYQCAWAAKTSSKQGFFIVAIKAEPDVMEQILTDADIQLYTPQPNDILPMVV